MGKINRIKRKNEPRYYYDIICVKCGKSGKLPYEPKADESTYCTKCRRLFVRK